MARFIHVALQGNSSEKLTIGEVVVMGVKFTLQYWKEERWGVVGVMASTPAVAPELHFYVTRCHVLPHPATLSLGSY